MTFQSDGGVRHDAERRAWPRLSMGRGGATSTGRLLPGRDVRIVDLCPGGALLETSYRLMPGRAVELQLGQNGNRLRVRGRILRCQVAALGLDGGVRYRGAICFEPRPVEPEEPVFTRG
jgi:hypothetical protein